ncbi:MULTISPECIES: hypothetical protein [unclassified Variovorax]|uniref:hypothetical protein n=1 Tax=unclassified Variovorax TaxID=663243 RepID=UPI0032E5F4BB
MTTENIALLSLIVSGLSIVLALFAVFGPWLPLWMGRHKITAHGSPFQCDDYLTLSISVSNVGKRPATIRFVQVQLPSSTTLSFPLLPIGSAHLDVGDIVEMVVPREVAHHLWKEIPDLHHLELAVVDSANRPHPISISGRSTKTKALRQL